MLGADPSSPQNLGFCSTPTYVPVFGITMAFSNPLVTTASWENYPVTASTSWKMFLFTDKTHTRDNVRRGCSMVSFVTLLSMNQKLEKPINSSLLHLQ